jgi:hypothetical protein
MLDIIHNPPEGSEELVSLVLQFIADFSLSIIAKRRSSLRFFACPPFEDTSNTDRRIKSFTQPGCGC